MGVRAALWRLRWFGYDDIAITRWNRKFNVYKAGASAFDKCESDTYRTTGEHIVRDHDDNHYYGKTMKSGVWVDCD
jgi:hypothetical protein